MIKKIKLLFKIILFTWVGVSSYITIKSSEFLTVRNFLEGMIDPDSKKVPLLKGSEFVKSFVDDHYLVKKKRSSEVLAFLKNNLTDKLFKKVSSDLEFFLSKNEFLTRDLNLQETYFDHEKETYFVVLKSPQRPEYQVVELSLEFVKDPNPRVKVSNLNEVTFFEKPSNLMNKGVFVSKIIKSRVKFPCSISSINLNSLDGVDAKLSESKSVLDFKLAKNFEDAKTYTTKCENRSFLSPVSASKKKTTLFKRIALQEGKLPPRRQAKKKLSWQEEVAREIRNWDD